MIEMLSLDLSNFCSKGCAFCYNSSNSIGQTSWEPEEVIRFLKDCIANGVKAVSLGGGEPFEYKGIFQVMEAIYPLCYLSVTSNGLPLENEEIWHKLINTKPDKIHLTIHNPDDEPEVKRVLYRLDCLKEIGIKPGINLLVAADKISASKLIYRMSLRHVSPEQIILVPQRYTKTPTPIQLSEITGGRPFQSPSCLLKCKALENFVSVSWDKRVNFCSFAEGKEPLESLDYKGLMEAMAKIEFKSCI
ncbi:MAG: radical SAM protein [Muribaculaceae bacterium]|nr:radical SAM protein [Muribaculaceae bacterium]